MKTVLYIGNHLSRSGGYPSVAETVAPLLMPDVQLHLVSRRSNRLLRFFKMLSAVLLHGRKEAPVVIDTYSTLNFLYALALAGLCRLLRIPYICVLHGGNLPARLERNPGLCRFLFGGAARLAAPSAYLQHAFQQKGYAAELIPNFIPLSNYPFRQRERVRPRLLWVRALEATYHPQMAVRVLHLLAQKYPEAALCMVGPDKDGSMQACRQLAQELGVVERARFTGRLSKAEWVALSQDYDIFINTTNFDNTPVSVIEAMALGLPVVSTNAGGMPYLVAHEQEGLLVDKGDVEGMHEAVCHLVNDPAIAQHLANNARQKVESFDWKHIKPLWLELLKTQ